MDKLPSPKTQVWEVKVEGNVLIRKLFSFIINTKPTSTEMEVIQHNPEYIDGACYIPKMYVTGITYENVIKLESLDYLLSEDKSIDTTSHSHEIITIHGYTSVDNCLIPYAESFWDLGDHSLRTIPGCYAIAYRGDYDYIDGWDTLSMLEAILDIEKE